MLNPVSHIEYYFEKGKGWVPFIVRFADMPRQAAKVANFGYPLRYTLAITVTVLPRHDVLR